MRRAVFAAFVAAAALATPAQAGWPDPDDYVTVEVNGPVVCVTEPCEQPPLLTVCVVPVGVCTAR